MSGLGFTGRTALGLVIGCALWGWGSPSHAADAQKTASRKAAEKALQLQVWNAIQAGSPAIDRCNSRYLVEYPAASGMVSLSGEVQKDGSVEKTVARTSLAGARYLRVCLQKAAKLWRFPAPSETDGNISISVIVKQGVKFKLKKPGEKPKPTQVQDDSSDSGFINLSGGWLPPEW